MLYPITTILYGRHLTLNKIFYFIQLTIGIIMPSIVENPQQLEVITCSGQACV